MRAYKEQHFNIEVKWTLAKILKSKTKTVQQKIAIYKWHSMVKCVCFWNVEINGGKWGGGKELFFTIGFEVSSKCSNTF